MRIRRSFVLGTKVLEKTKRKSFWVATAVPIAYKRDRNICELETQTNIFEKRLVLGSIFNLRYIHRKSWWGEITTGLENESHRSCGTAIIKDSRTGFDDVVLTGGYNMYFSTSGKADNAQVVLYGLAGFPTRRRVKETEKNGFLVGTRLFNLGVGSEFSYSLINKKRKSWILVFQNRVLHFFDRRLVPILPPEGIFHPGNVWDLLFTTQYRIGKNIFETGYNATFFNDEKVILPTQVIKSENFVRNSVYFTYAYFKRKSFIFKKPLVLGCGLSVARAKRFHTKILSGWLNFTLIF